MLGNFKKTLKLTIAILIAMGTLLSVLSNDSVTTDIKLIKEYKTHPLSSLVNIPENNFEDEDGLHEKGRSVPSSLILFSNLASFNGISQFRLIESNHTEKRVFLLFRHLRI